MAVDGGYVGISPALAIRSNVGVEVWEPEDSNLHYKYEVHLPREKTKSARSISFSPDGFYFAYSNGQEIRVVQTSDWRTKCTLPRPKALYLKFSPLGNYLSTWELYTVSQTCPEGSPNMFVYELSSSKQVFATIQKKQIDWEPSWSTDESIFAIVVGGEALFYDLVVEGADGFKIPSRKIGGSRDGMLSLAPGSSYYMAFYTPGKKGAPSMCKLYKYPALSQNQAIACKSFFQADRIDMLWNRRGTGLLLLTSTEVDKSGASYYGNQALHFMATKGETCSVPLYNKNAANQNHEIQNTDISKCRQIKTPTTVGGWAAFGRALEKYPTSSQHRYAGTVPPNQLFSGWILKNKLKLWVLDWSVL